MASGFRRQTAEPANARTVLRNKLANDIKPQSDTKRRVPVSKVSEMSPEARKAMLMAKEDSKENLTSGTRNVIPGLDTDVIEKSRQSSNDNSDYSNANRLHGATNTGTKDMKSTPRKIIQRSTGNRTREPPRVGATTAATARSRSTLSRTDPSYSISDHNESCYNYGNGSVKHRGTNYATSSLYNNDSHDNEDEDNNNNNPNKSPKEQVDDDDLDDNNVEELNDDAEAGENTKSASPKSFVLALNRALEENCISRLRGDITDTTGISEPGKVRALDGGRLANAQEVVVNVCHEDDRELVFHDEDDESLDNAKTISEIRINIWMEYNEEFQPDNITDDLDIGTSEDAIADTPDPEKSKTKLSVPSKASMTPRGRDAGKANIGKTSITSRSNSRSSKGPVVKTDGNNNSLGSRSKSGTSGSFGDGSSVRVGSAISTASSRRSGLGSAKKESYLKRKART